MSFQVFYLDIIRILSDRREMPVEMLALKLGTSSSSVIEVLEKLQQVNVVKLDIERKNVKISNPDSIPTMKQFYALAG